MLPLCGRGLGPYTAPGECGMTTILVLLLFGYVVYLDRRVASLQRALHEMDGRTFSRTLPYAPAAPLAEPEPEPVADRTVLRAEPWPGTTATAADAEPAALHAAAAPLQAFPVEPATLATEPEPEPDRPVEAERPAFSFEELFGRRLPIWAGGITLAVAGFLIVKYSIDAGFFSPALRVVAGLLFGLALIGGAEWAGRRADFVQDERVAQALSGAGIASLYGSVLVAANLYGLIGAGAAMVGMTLVTALALWLALRFGSPSALLGLAGGLAAPALIGSAEPNIPLLMLYLALAVGGLAAVSRRQRWAWLGISALVGGFGWSLFLLLTGALTALSSITLALFVLLVGVVLPALALEGSSNRDRLRLLAGGAAAVQIAALVATGGFTPLHWGLFALLGIALQVLRQREPALSLLPPLALAVGLMLGLVWPSPSATALALVLAGGALIFGLPAAWRLWRADGSLVDAGQLVALGLASPLLWQWHVAPAPGEQHGPSGGVALLSSAILAALVFTGWGRKDRLVDRRFAVIATAAALSLALAAAHLLPTVIVPVGIALIAALVLEGRHRSGDPRLEPAAWGLLVLAGLFLLNSTLVDEASRALGVGVGTSGLGFVRWLLLAATLAFFGVRATHRPLSQVAQGCSLLAAYVALAQLLPPTWLPLIAPALLLLAAGVERRTSRSLLAAELTAVAVIGGWAVEPLGLWLGAGVPALIGVPMLAVDLPSASDSLLRLLLPGLAIMAAQPAEQRPRRFLLALGGGLLLVGLHSLYKELFDLRDMARFQSLGLGERLVWDALLAGVGAAAWRWRDRLGRLPAFMLFVLAAAHHLWFSLLLHNPLWAAQAVGPWPFLNLLLPLYGAPLALLFLAERRGLVAGRALQAVNAAQMLLLALFGLSLLQQLFAGSLLQDGTLGQAEDIARSIIAIALAIGFLLWGIRSRQRSWRIGSLLLMLGAVAKVFLFDASGLEGLVRIASFVALGLSLIGIGWLYARQLGSEQSA